MAEDKKLPVEDEGDYVDIVTLTDDEGNDTEFEVVGTLEDGGKLSYALAPLENEDGEFYVFVASKDENGDDILSTVDDDEEFDRIADMFEDELFSEADYDVQ